MMRTDYFNLPDMKTKETTTKDGKTIIWDEESGVGLLFTKGESLQRYNSAIVLGDPDKATTEEGIAEISRVENLLTEEAYKLYPYEFTPLKDPTE